MWLPLLVFFFVCICSGFFFRYCCCCLRLLHRWFSLFLLFFFNEPSCYDLLILLIIYNLISDEFLKWFDFHINFSVSFVFITQKVILSTYELEYLNATYTISHANRLNICLIIYIFTPTIVVLYCCSHVFTSFTMYWCDYGCFFFSSFSFCLLIQSGCER